MPERGPAGVVPYHAVHIGAESWKAGAGEPGHEKDGAKERRPVCGIDPEYSFREKNGVIEKPALKVGPR